MLLAVACSLLTVQDPTPAIHAVSRRSGEFVFRVSIPWPAGAHHELQAVDVEGDLAPCVTLLRWPDGSVAVSQVHARARFEAGRERRLRIRALEQSAPTTSDPFPFDVPPPLRIELRDGHDRGYIAAWTEDPARALESDLSSPRVRVRRYRSLFARDEAGAVEALFAMQGILIERAGDPVAELTVVLDNDPREGEPVPGPARFRSLRILADGDGPAMRLRHAALSGGTPVVRETSQGRVVELVGPDDTAYLGDRTQLVFRLDIARDTAHLDGAGAVFAVPDAEWTRTTGAFAAFGGPTRPDPQIDDAISSLHRWRRRTVAGSPFALLADVLDPASDGVRTAPIALHDVLLWRSRELAELAEATALRQGLRPTPATEPRLADEAAHLRAGLGPRAIATPHGVHVLDYEHFGVDLLFDEYWSTGDPWVRGELARVGHGLLPLLAHVAMRTSRGEGRCLRAGVLIARATADRSLLTALVAHAEREVLPRIAAAPRGCAIVQPPHPRAFASELPFDAPEQMAELSLGLVALAEATDRDALRDAALEVTRRIARDAWITGYGPAGYVGAGDRPELLGAPGEIARFGESAVVACALCVAHGIARSEQDRRLFARRVDELRGDSRVPPAAMASTDGWEQIVRDRAPRIR
ncbi:MAG: hypothetical protein U1F36_16350 [Planctomycetota bacterium]